MRKLFAKKKKKPELASVPFQAEQEGFVNKHEPSDQEAKPAASLLDSANAIHVTPLKHNSRRLHRPTSSPPSLVMPRPRYAVAPTRAVLRNYEKVNEKTQLDPEPKQDSPPLFLPQPPSKSTPVLSSHEPAVNTPILAPNKDPEPILIQRKSLDAAVEMVHKKFESLVSISGSDDSSRMYDTALESPPGSLATFDSNSLNTSLAFANPITQVHSHQPPDVAPLIQPKLKVTQPHPAKPAQPHLLGRRSLQQLMPSSSTTTPASDRLPPQLLDLTQSTISSSSHASTATHLTQLPLHPQPSVPHLHLQPSAVPASDSSETVTPAGTIVNVALASLSTAEQQQEIELLRQEVQNVLLQTAMERKEFQRKEQEHRERTRRMQEEINRTNDKVMFLTSKHQSFLPKDAADDALAGPDRPQPSTSTSHQRAARPRSNSQHSQSLSRSNSKHSQHLSLSPAAALQKQPHASPAVSATFERPQSSRDRQRPHAEDDTPPSGSISRQSSGRRSRSSASGSLRAPPSHVHGPSFQHTPNLQPKPAPRRLRSKSTEPPLRPHPMEQAVHLQQRPMARPRSNSGGLVFPAGAMRSQSVGDYEYFYSDPPHRPDFDTSDPESSVLDEEDDDLDDDGTMDDESEEMEDQDYLNRMYYTHHAPPHGMLPPRSSSQQRQRQPRSSPFHYDTSFPPRRMRQPGRHHPPPLHMHHGMPMLPPYLSPRYMHPSDSPAYHPVPRSRPSSRHDMAPPPPFAYDPAMSFYPMMPPGRGRRRPSPVIPHDPLDNDYGRQRHPQPIPTYRHWHPDDY